jgi:hypothetical protein
LNAEGEWWTGLKPTLAVTAAPAVCVFCARVKQRK